MSSTGASTDASTETPEVGTIEMKLEVVTLPVSDVDRAKSFYQSLGWRLDADFVVGDGVRAIQLRPPHSGCSIAFGKGLITAEPSTRRGRTSSDAVSRSARCFIATGAVFFRGPDPEHRSYLSYASFSDPDGNSWLLQEVTTRLPGRMWDE
jgi:catechol 2,3-dioxygenase-like lactoylglutathione lyase family enzyme